MYGDFSWQKLGKGRATATIEGFTGYDIRQTAAGWGVTDTHGMGNKSDFFPTLREAIGELRKRADIAFEYHLSEHIAEQDRKGDEIAEQWEREQEERNTY